MDIKFYVHARQGQHSGNSHHYLFDNAGLVTLDDQWHVFVAGSGNGHWLHDDGPVTVLCGKQTGEAFTFMNASVSGFMAPDYYRRDESCNDCRQAYITLRKAAFAELDVSIQDSILAVAAATGSTELGI